MHQAPTFPTVKGLALAAAHVAAHVAADMAHSTAKKAKEVAVDAGCTALGIALTGLFICPVIAIYTLDRAIGRMDY